MIYDCVECGGSGRIADRVVCQNCGGCGCYSSDPAEALAEGIPYVPEVRAPEPVDFPRSMPADRHVNERRAVHGRA